MIDKESVKQLTDEDLVNKLEDLKRTEEELAYMVGDKIMSDLCKDIVIIQLEIKRRKNVF